MCGFSGIVSKKKPVEPGQIEGMLSSLRHRGPDGLGFHRTRFAHAGMNRLAVLDLQRKGLCPVLHKEKSGSLLVLVYNGEIYNCIELREYLIRKGYRFNTTCDSEVLLQAYREWGVDCLDRLNGMFSFAIFDYAKDQLFAARDRVGEKPFCYYHDGNQFVFASEIKAILTQIPKPDVLLTDAFRAFEYMPGEETLFKGIYNLLPAHWLLLKGIRGNYKSLRIARYWDVPNRIRKIPARKAIDTLDELLQDSIRLRLRSDVPWGLYLSGGIDSSLIAYIARPSICFSCHFPYGPKYDELAYAKRVAQNIKTRHIIIRPTEKDLKEALPSMMYHLDMPIGTSSMFPLYMLAQEAKKHVKVVISGEGSDELFSGYTRYLILLHEQKLYKIPSLANYKPLLDFYYGHPLDRFARILNRRPGLERTVGFFIAPHFKRFRDIVHAMGYVDFKLMLVALLHTADRSSAAFGLENRAPFLDHRIVEFAFSIPGNFKIKDMTAKWILKKVAERYLPKLVMERTSKMGLVTPINLWMHYKGPRGEFDREDYNRLCMETWRSVFFTRNLPASPARLAALV